MVNKIGWFCSSAAGLAIGIAVPATAAKPVAIEKDLLGVRVLQSYREVLARYGAPIRVFRANETVNYTEAVSLDGAGTGGILGVAGATTGGPMVGAGGGPMMGAGGMGGPGAPMMSGGPGGGGPGMMGSGGMRGMMSGGQRNPGMMGGGGPGMMGGGMSGMGSGGGPGMMGGAAQGGAGGGEGTFGNAVGFIWVYLYPGKELAYEFHFNKDGRVERIVELGRGFGQHTSRGIGLSDTVEKVYGIYGWTDSIKEESAGKFSLMYNDKYHAQFLVLKNKVVGISVFLRENQFMRYDGGSNGGGMAAPGMSGMSRNGFSGGGGPSAFSGGFTPGNKPIIAPRGGK